MISEKNQNIDRLIQRIKSITENRCSLSDDDVGLLNEVMKVLEKVKRRRDKTLNLILIIKSVQILLKFFRS
jgi:hypothetical protein